MIRRRRGGGRSRFDLGHSGQYVDLVRACEFGSVHGAGVVRAVPRRDGCCAPAIQASEGLRATLMKVCYPALRPGYAAWVSLGQGVYDELLLSFVEKRRARRCPAALLTGGGSTG